jgi:hypothetical protein
MERILGEVVEWTIADKQHLILSRPTVPPDAVDVKKNSAMVERRAAATTRSRRGDRLLLSGVRATASPGA